jgi:hypothetical protein
MDMRRATTQQESTGRIPYALPSRASTPAVGAFVLPIILDIFRRDSIQTEISLATTQQSVLAC